LLLRCCRVPLRARSSLPREHLVAVSSQEVPGGRWSRAQVEVLQWQEWELNVLG